MYLYLFVFLSIYVYRFLRIEQSHTIEFYSITFKGSFCRSVSTANITTAGIFLTIWYCIAQAYAMVRIVCNKILEGQIVVGYTLLKLLMVMNCLLLTATRVVCRNATVSA